MPSDRLAAVGTVSADGTVVDTLIAAGGCLQLLGGLAASLRAMDGRKRLRFVLRTMRHWRQGLEWQAFLGSRDMASVPPAIRAALLQKIYRPYSRRHLAAECRLHLLRTHYRFLGHVMPAEVFTRLFQSEGITLCRLDGRDGSVFALVLRRDCRFDREGEITFSLRDDASGMELATLTGLFGTNEDGGRCFSIGGLQGPRPPYGRDEVVAATRALNGLRPKRAVLEAVLAFAGAIGVRTVAASNVTHVGCRRAATMVAAYDEFWLECGGEALANGDYRLPAAIARKDESQVPSRKRKAWRERMALLGRIDAGMRAVLEEGCG